MGRNRGHQRGDPVAGYGELPWPPTHRRAPDPSAGDAVPARAPAGHLPIRRGVHRSWIPLSHLVRDSLTGPIPWGWRFAHRRISLAPAPLRIRTGSSLETWVVRPGAHRGGRPRVPRGRRDPARAPSPRADSLATPLRRRPFGAMSASGSRQTRAGCGSLGPPFLGGGSWVVVPRTQPVFVLGRQGRLRRRLLERGSLAPPFSLAVGVWHHPLLPARESSTTLSRALPSVALPMLSES